MMTVKPVVAAAAPVGLVVDLFLTVDAFASGGQCVSHPDLQ